MAAWHNKLWRPGGGYNKLWRSGGSPPHHDRWRRRCGVLLSLDQISDLHHAPAVRRRRGPVTKDIPHNLLPGRGGGDHGGVNWHRFGVVGVGAVGVTGLVVWCWGWGHTVIFGPSSSVAGRGAASAACSHRRAQNSVPGGGAGAEARRRVVCAPYYNFSQALYLAYLLHS